MLEVSGAVRQL